MSRAPALIGWSQVSRFEGEPLEAWAEAVRLTGVPPAAIDSLDVVYCQSWPYDDPPGRLAAALGAEPKRLHYSGIGGTTPLSLLGQAADRIERGESDVCVIVGGEALATVRAAKRAGARLPWTHRDPEKKPFPFEAPFHPAEVAHQVFQAYTTFALRDVARRAHRGETVAEHRESIGRLFAPMTEVAATNPNAWFPQARSATELMEVKGTNRVVAHPFTKLVVAMMDVDQVAALVLASTTEGAGRLGIGADRRVYLRGWAQDRDPDYVAEHDALWKAPAMRSALGGALTRAGVGVDEVAYFDLYSCFASSVTFSLDALGLDAGDGRPFTVTGGLPYAGGPGSCYALGAVAAMADRLVADPGALGLVTTVGMHLSKHAGAVLSNQPAPVGPPAPVLDPDRVVRRPIVNEISGPAQIAAYTVHHDRDGAPSDGLLVCELDGGARGYARVEDAGVLEAMEAEEWVGRSVEVHPDGGVNRARPA